MARKLTQKELSWIHNLVSEDLTKSKNTKRNWNAYILSKKQVEELLEKIDKW